MSKDNLPVALTFGPITFTLTGEGYRTEDIGPEPTIIPHLTIHTFEYNGKPRTGIDLGRDTRPGTTNRMYYTYDGMRSFKEENITDLKTKASFDTGALKLTNSDTNIEELI